ncbi:GxxExxY protein [bacterium]|nr:GxxExxY protein [bacterium]
MALKHQGLTEQIIGAAITVHKNLGPGFIESIYENALVHELKKRGLGVDQQMDISVVYDGIEVGKHRLDLLVNKTIVVELKAIKEFENIHFAVVRSYLKALNLEHGLLINFGKIKVDVKRVITK